MNPLPSRRTRHLRVVADVDDPPPSLVADFANAVARKLGRGGSPEDQLRSPLEILIERIGQQFGLDPIPYGEVNLKEIRARPDYAVDVGRSRVGYIELKAPGRGIPPEWRPDKREREQWEKLCSLPNVIYTDGYNWGAYRYGELREPILRIAKAADGSERISPHASDKLQLLIRKFLTAKPTPPHSLTELITIVARLCRLLKDDVTAVLSFDSSHPAREHLDLLAGDLRQRLFPDLTDEDFADAYAQSITFALLLAQVNGIILDELPLHEIGRQLAKKHSLIGRVFSVLTDGEAADELVTIETLRQVIGTVDWASLRDKEKDIYVELYENFLEQYDPAKRRESGSYYTPEPVANFMVEFVDEILQDRLKRSWGFADDGVVVLDPAMGTGTFLIEVMRRVAATIDAKQGPGARSDRLRDLFRKRLIGFERQMGPYAVAELRLHEALKVRFETDLPVSDVRFLTNTLSDPYTDSLPPTAAYKVIEQSHDEANRIKREERVMVAIGNPPHVGDAKKQGAWLVGKGKPRRGFTPSTRPSIDDFRTLQGGKYESDLHGLQWYFLRWALWKVFDAHPDHPMGVVALLLPESITDSHAFAGIREYLRRTCDEGWIIDLSPEGNRSDSNTRVFGSKVSRRLCVAVFARWRQPDRDSYATFHHMTLRGDNKQKLDCLKNITLQDRDWKTCPKEWQGPLFHVNASWHQYPALSDLMPWRSRGMTTGRSWVYAPQSETLQLRWRELTTAERHRRKSLFEEKNDRSIDSIVNPLPGFPAPGGSLADEEGPCPTPVLVAYRSFDRQWVIPDNRLMERARTALWAVRSSHQIFVSEDMQATKSGPGLIFCADVPDIDHFHGSEASLVRPLYRSPETTAVNITRGLLNYLSQRLGIKVTAGDFIAYVAGLVAHRGYTLRFAEYLDEPGVRLPLTGERILWTKVVEIGKEIIWLHTFGERFVDHRAGRPKGALALSLISNIKSYTPVVAHPPGMPELITPTEIPGSSDLINLRVGDGVVGPVRKDVWDYEVNGMNVVSHWFDSRRSSSLHKRNKKGLNAKSFDSWTSGVTDELLAMLSVLSGCVQLEPQQLALLDQVREGKLITSSELLQVSVLPPPDSAFNGPSPRSFTIPALPGM
jgi:Type ISP C-terminal specificity domain/N-6 DNA Methylase